MTPKPDRGARVPSPDATLDIALSLAAVGWPVFPVSIYEDADGKRHKVPAVKWKAEATTDADVIRAWWTGEHAHRWIGVYAGAAGIVVLDIDPAKGDVPSGSQSLEAAGFDVPKTFNYPTHRKGGRHHVYRAPDGVDLTIAKGLLPGVDVRSGAGLMVYYGPRLDGPPRLAPAPDWLLVKKGAPSGASTSADRAPDANVDEFFDRLPGGKPDPDVRAALAKVKRDGMGHDDMLEAVTELVSLGVRGHRGVGRALEVARDTYSRDWPDAERSWDNAVSGSVRRLGLPPLTLEIPKDERKAIKKRNRPEAIEKAKAERAATFRIEKHAEALTAPSPGTRVLEDAPLAAELAETLRHSWAYSRGLGLMRYVTVDAFGEHARDLVPGVTLPTDAGGRWRSAEDHSLIEAVRRMLVEIEIHEHDAAARRGDNRAIDKARTLLSRARASAVARLVIGILAEAEPVFDAHPDLLNTPSGVVDLRTGERLPPDPTLYLTKMTGAAYDPDADMTMWRKATEALPAKTVDWLQVRMGQAATGYTPEDDVLLIFEGAGENGKTGWLIGFRRAMGDYATTLPERLLVGDPGDHPTTLMNLMGARVGVIEELPEGRSLNVKRLKDTVGTPEITARKMRQDDVTFPATHALFLATNYLPIVTETDHGTWRRLALVRFRHRYVKSVAKMTGKRDRLGDPAIKRHFERAEDPGLLRWLVEGARRWYENGQRFPEPPARVEKDTEAWRLDADPILAYAGERLVRDESCAITTADLAEDFNLWLERRGHRRWTQQTINSRFQGHVALDGVERKMVKFGLSLRPSRPAFSIKPVPKNTTAWRGIRFADEKAIVSEAEQDAATLADLARRLNA